MGCISGIFNRKQEKAMKSEEEKVSENTGSIGQGNGGRQHEEESSKGFV